MRKRPLCIAVLAMAVVLWLLPAEIWMEDPLLAGAEPPDYLCGEVCALEQRENGQTVCLKNTNLSDTGKVLVYLSTREDLSLGNTLLISQFYKLSGFEKPGNPGQFDARLYYQTQGIVLSCYAKSCEVIDADSSFLEEGMRNLREQLLSLCGRLFSAAHAPVMKAMLLGDKSTLEQELKETYQKAGISHLLAISGLHVSIVGMGLYRTLRKLGLWYPCAGVVSLFSVWFYGNLTGMGTSTFRAVVMFTLTVGADLCGRSYDMLSALALSALLLLLQEPLYARNAAFLLSFGAVLGVGLCFPALQSLFPLEEGKRKTFGKSFRQSLLVSLSIQLFILPVLEYFYYEISLYGIFLNLLVIPLMSVLMPMGILSLVTGLCSTGAALVPAKICEGILFFYEFLSRNSLKLPKAVLICGQPARWQMLLYDACLLSFLGWRFWKMEQEKGKSTEERDLEKGDKEFQRRLAGDLFRLRLKTAAGAVLLCCLLSWRFQGGFQFTMLDVGQGDGLFLRTASGTTCLVDGGSSDVKEVGRYRILPFLKSQGIGKLDYVFVTHTDQDHISGIEELLVSSGEAGGVRIQNLILPAGERENLAEEETALEKLHRLAQKKEIPVYFFSAGMELRDQTTIFSCLHPQPGECYEDKNAGSLTLRVSYKDFAILLTGDLENLGEKEILETMEQEGLKACVLKVGHHGSKGSSSQAWLEKVRPRVSLISCGADNSYGHPHKETLLRLEETGSAVFGTQECGAITVYSDGKKFRVERFRKVDYI